MSENINANAIPPTANPAMAQRWTDLADGGSAIDIHRIFQARRGYEAFLDRRSSTMLPRKREQITADIAFIDELITERELVDPSRTKRLAAFVMQKIHKS